MAVSFYELRLRLPTFVFDVKQNQTMPPAAADWLSDRIRSKHDGKEATITIHESLHCTSRSKSHVLTYQSYLKKTQSLLSIVHVLSCLSLEDPASDASTIRHPLGLQRSSPLRS